MSHPAGTSDLATPTQNIEVSDSLPPLISLWLSGRIESYQERENVMFSSVDN